MGCSAETKRVRRVARLCTTAGVTLMLGGSMAWYAVTRQLRGEKITVPDDADFCAGREVCGPITAIAQAAVIRRNAERSTGGKTFADISEALREVEKGSEQEQRLRGQSAALATAASLRTSLLTAVLAYGVSVLVAGLGTLFSLTGAQLGRSRWVARRSGH